MIGVVLAKIQHGTIRHQIQPTNQRSSDSGEPRAIFLRNGILADTTPNTVKTKKMDANAITVAIRLHPAPHSSARPPTPRRLNVSPLCDLILSVVRRLCAKDPLGRTRPAARCVRNGAPRRRDPWHNCTSKITQQQTFILKFI